MRQQAAGVLVMINARTDTDIKSKLTDSRPRLQTLSLVKAYTGIWGTANFIPVDRNPIVRHIE
eukprot:14195903-Ditylum_brightwellii.AAC.1